MKKQLNNTRGETIVEVVVAFLLLLLFTAVFTTALRYAQTMRLKTEQLREAAFQLCGQVYPLNGAMQQGIQNESKTKTYTFQTLGNSFTIRDVTLYELEAEDADTGTTYTFHTYGKEAAP